MRHVDAKQICDSDHNADTSANTERQHDPHGLARHTAVKERYASSRK